MFTSILYAKVHERVIESTALFSAAESREKFLVLFHAESRTFEHFMGLGIRAIKSDSDAPAIS